MYSQTNSDENYLKKTRIACMKESRYIIFHSPKCQHEDTRTNISVANFVNPLISRVEKNTEYSEATETRSVWAEVMGTKLSKNKQVTDRVIKKLPKNTHDKDLR